MGVFFIYMLKSAVCLGLFYLFFRLLLSRETFHEFNRVALLGVLILSWLIPWVELTTVHPIEMNNTVLTIEQMLLMAQELPASGTMEAAKPPVVSWIQILLLFYLSGILFFVFRNLYSLARLVRLLLSCHREKMEKDIVLAVHEREIAPFSWMKFIVISRKDLEENGREILIHEKAHIARRHSIDLLLADISIFFQWFNPAAWLLKQELQNIHEYEADETVINGGVSAKEYQLLLIKKAVGTRLYSMANSFNHSKLKKRITMMLKEKSSPWARLKYLYVLPLAALAVTAFARPEVSAVAEEISVVKVNDLTAVVQEKVPKDTVKATPAKEEEVFVVVEEMPKFPGGMDALRKYLADKVADSKMSGKANGRIVVGFTVSETGKVTNAHVLESNATLLNEEALRIVREMPDWNPGKQRGKTVVVKYSVPVTFGSGEEKKEKEKTSVIHIRGEQLEFTAGTTKGDRAKALVYVNGKEISSEQMQAMDPASIESMTILKDASATAKYGERGAHGVILITSKKEKGSVKDNVRVKITTSENGDLGIVPSFPVEGTVTGDQGPVAGVSVLVPNTHCGTVTDAKGHFSLKAIEGGELLFSFVGYKSARVLVTPKMQVKLEKDVIKLEP